MLKEGSPSDMTTLLRASREGDRHALGQVFSMSYGELQRLAHKRLAKRHHQDSLSTATLVHECYLRLCGNEGLSLEDRRHFFAYTAQVMRSVVIDFARERTAQRRGGEFLFVTVNTDIPDHEALDAEQLLQVEDAIAELSKTEPRLVQVVEMKYFAGFTFEEIADHLQIAERTVRRDWSKARLLLYASLALDRKPAAIEK